MFGLLGALFPWGEEALKEGVWVLEGHGSRTRNFCSFTESKGGCVVYQALSHSASIAPEVTLVGRIPPPPCCILDPSTLCLLPAGQLYSDS